MKTYHVYGLGAALVDTEIQTSDEFLAQASIDKGVMTLVDDQRQTELMNVLKDHLVGSKRASGGSACNSIIAASYFGAKSFYSGKVANDENGDFFVSDLNAANVEFHKNPPEEGITGKCLVMITPDAERTMNTYLGINDHLTEAELDYSSISESEYLYIEGYLVTSDTRKNVAINARKHAEANNVKTSISLSDPAMVQFFKEGLLDMIGDQVDLLFCNKDEALNFTNTTTIEAASEALKAYAKTFAITLGAEGSLVFDGKDTHTIAGQTVKAIDTNGAGDMFAGAFIYAITHNYSYQQAAFFANTAAAKVVSQYGPRLAGEEHAPLKDALHKA